MAPPENLDKYSRQILFEPIGEQGQRRLLDGRAAIVGCGALGSFHAAALARAGVGELLLIDRDYVEQSNLQRQWLYDEADAAEAAPKAVAAARKLATLNADVTIRTEVCDLTAANAERLLSGVDVILDGTDNFETRYLVNETAVKLGVPWIYGAAVGSYGLTAPIVPGRGACLVCLLPEPPGGALPTCDTAGILNVCASAVASYQVADAIKILAGRADALQLRLLTLDVWTGEHRTISAASADPDCEVCGKRRFERLEAGRESASAVLCGRNAVQIRGNGAALDLADLSRRLTGLGEVRLNEYVLRFVAPPREMTVFSDGRAIIKGVDDIAAARSFYARYVGR